MSEFDELIKSFGKKTFELKEDHIKLLRKAYVDWVDCEFGAPCIDPKRPYGNSSVYADIAEILEIRPLTKKYSDDFSEEQKEYMFIIHRGTQMALQIMLYTGKLEAGIYESPNYHSDMWRKEKE